MAEILYLNGYNVDLSGAKITRKIQIGEVSNVTERRSSYSYTLKLLYTATNVKVLDMLGAWGNTSRKPFENITADYVVNTIYLIKSGMAVVRSSVNNKYFEVNLIDGVRSLSELLNSKKLIDLPLADVSHMLSTQVYVDSFSNDSGYIYGLADFGRGISSTVKVEKQAPSIFTHTLFRRIFESNGLSLQGDFFTTNNKYLNEVVTPSNGYTVEAGQLVSTPSGAAESNSLSRYDMSSSFISFEDKFTLSDDDLIGVIITDGNLDFVVPGVYKLDVTAFYSLYDSYAQLKIVINDEAISYVDLDQGNSLIKSKTIEFNVEAGDIVKVYVVGTSLNEPEETGQYEVNYSANVDLDLYVQTGGQLIEAANYLGEMMQIDFVKDVVNRYGLVLHPVRNTNEFKFERLEVVLNNRDSAEDWTGKIVDIGGEDYISGYSKSNKAIYSYPDSIVDPSHDGTMVIDNENAEVESELFTSVFEIPAKSNFVLSEQMYKIPIWGEESDIETEIETELQEDTQTDDEYLVINGTLSSSSDYVVREYDNIDPLNKSYKATGRVNQTDNALVCFYDINDVFISYQFKGDGSDTDYTKTPLFIPSNCKTIRVSGKDVFLPILYQYEDITTATAVNEETPMKIMHINRQDKTITAKFFNEVTGITVSENIPFLNLDFISMQYLLDNNYKAFKSLINNYKSLKMRVNLSVIDIFNLDFFRLKFLKQTGRFYYLNSVLNTAGEVSSVEAIEIREFPANLPPSQIGDFDFYMNHGTSRTITYSNLTQGYEDPENNLPLKFKIISGFNANVLLQQDGITITSETEINVSDLELQAVEVLGGTNEYNESWVFAIADEGSGEYGTETGVITVNVLQYVNEPPVADAGANQEGYLLPPNIQESITFILNGSASYDLTGEIVSYEWEITGSPAASDSFLQAQNTSAPMGTLEVPNDEDNEGLYTLTLTVTDEFGATDTDSMTVTVSAY